MREAYLDVAETFANESYEKELVITKQIFQKVKSDLVCKFLTYFIFLLDKIVLLY